MAPRASSVSPASFRAGGLQLAGQDEGHVPPAGPRLGWAVLSIFTPASRRRRDQVLGLVAPEVVRDAPGGDGAHVVDLPSAPPRWRPPERPWCRSGRRGPWLPSPPPAGCPRPYSRRLRSLALEFSMAPDQVFGGLLPHPVQLGHVLRRGGCTGPRRWRPARRRPAAAPPPDRRPSMSMASRLAKWVRFRSSWAGHSAPVQRRAAPSSSRTTGAPQTGQVVRQRVGHRALRAFVEDPRSTISGMISPAFCTSTVSPMRMSFSVMIVLVVEGGVGDGGARQPHRLTAPPWASARRCGPPAPRCPGPRRTSSPAGT